MLCHQALTTQPVIREYQRSGRVEPRNLTSESDEDFRAVIFSQTAVVNARYIDSQILN